MIVVLATGSRGDVQPFVGLAYRQRQNGHPVTVVTNARFEAWVRSYDLDMRPIQWDAQASLQSDRGQKMVQSGGLLDGLKYALKESPRIFARVQRESWEQCQGARFLVYSLISPWGQPVAEKLGIPAVPGLLHPMIPTRAFPTQLCPVNLGKKLNWLSHVLGEWAMWLVIQAATNAFRKELGLSVIRFPRTLFDLIRQQDCPLLCSLSPTIIPRPFDWPESVKMDGYWFLPSPPGWAPPIKLVNFIRSGLPPVYVGFGSMANQGAQEMTRLVFEALRISGQRGVLARGWWAQVGDITPSKDIYLLDDAPHEWLFPHMAAVVHHGGAGTTAAGFRAGVPQVVVPHMQDQPYWGSQVFKLGAGPKPIPRRSLTASSLAEAISAAVTDPRLKTKSALIGEKIRAEDGVGKCVRILDEYFLKLL